jgi:hypothetical protein
MSKTLQTVVECKCGQNRLPYMAIIEKEKCSRCGNYTEQEHQAIQDEILNSWSQGVKEGLKAVQGYRDSLERIVNWDSNQLIGDFSVICDIQNFAQQALSAAPTTQDTNVLDELETWLVEEINDFKSGIDSSDISVANYLQLCVLSKIQSLKPKP